MTAKELLDTLRAAVAEFGGDTPINRLDLNRETEEVETGYWSDKMNPARGGKSPPLYFVADEHGIVLGRYGKDDDPTLDVHKVSLIRSYAKRKRVIAETRSYPGNATDQPIHHPNEHLDTPMTTSTPETKSNA